MMALFPLPQRDEQQSKLLDAERTTDQQMTNLTLNCGLDNIVQHPGTSSCTITTEAEIHPEPPSSEIRENPLVQLEINNSDTIDLALNIAKDTVSVKSDIKRVENIINNKRNANASEHEILIMLLNSIQENVDKIDSKAACLDEKVRALSQKVTSQEKV